MSAFQLYRPGNDFEFCCQISENSCFVAKTKILCACQQSKQRYYVHASNQAKGKQRYYVHACNQAKGKQRHYVHASNQAKGK